jgi:hypothetical protein
MAGVGGLELRNVAANYPFERAEDLRESSRIQATETHSVFELRRWGAQRNAVPQAGDVKKEPNLI